MRNALEKLALTAALIALAASPHAGPPSSNYAPQGTPPPIPSDLSALGIFSGTTIKIVEKNFAKKNKMGEYVPGGTFSSAKIYIDTAEIMSVFGVTEPLAISALQSSAIVHELLHSAGLGLGGNAGTNKPANQKNCEHMAVTLAAIPDFLCTLVTLLLSYPPEIVSCDVIDELCAAVQAGVDYVNGGTLWSDCHTLTTATPPGYVTPAGVPGFPAPTGTPVAVCDEC